MNRTWTYPRAFACTSARSQKGACPISRSMPPLLNGHENIRPCRQEAAPLVVQGLLPSHAGALAPKTKVHGDLDGVTAAMRKHLVDFLFDKLMYFQDFDAVKIYYDDGQESIAQAIHKVVDYVLAKDAVAYRLASSSDYRLSQIADYTARWSWPPSSTPTRRPPPPTSSSSARGPSSRRASLRKCRRRESS